MDEILFGVKDEMNRLMKIDEEGHLVSRLTEGERKDLHYAFGELLGKVLFDYLEEFPIRENMISFLGSILAERHPTPGPDMSKVKSPSDLSNDPEKGWKFWNGSHWEGPYRTKKICLRHRSAYKKAMRDR